MTSRTPLLPRKPDGGDELGTYGERRKEGARETNGMRKRFGDKCFWKMLIWGQGVVSLA